jgi:hypothetical protein
LKEQKKMLKLSLDGPEEQKRKGWLMNKSQGIHIYSINIQ